MVPERFLSASGDSEEDDQLFNVAIATIFAREFLEGAIIIGNYRTVIKKSDQWDEERKQKALRLVTVAAVLATLVAVLVVVAIAIPLGILSKDLDERVVEIIEGVSKVIASICILQLSLKIPVWLGLYTKAPLLYWCNGSLKEKKVKDLDNLTDREIKFNVAWNIWREVAECGVFLIPFFLGTGAKAIPLSAVVGIGIALVIGLGIYIASNRMRSRLFLSFFMSGLTLFLSVGLMVGGCHEFEEVAGETKNVYKINGDFWSDKKFPMVILKPFGYSQKRSVLQITMFWVWLTVGVNLHVLKYKSAKLAEQHMLELEAEAKLEEEEEDVEQPREGPTEHYEAETSSNEEETPSSSGEDSRQDFSGEDFEEANDAMESENAHAINAVAN